MGVLNWFKRKLAAIAIATASVEKAALTQDGEGDLANATGKFQRHRQGSLADSLKEGEETQQVQELRWRMYKVLEKAQNYKTEHVGYDEDGFIITEQVKIDDSEIGKGILHKIKVDKFDDYKLELSIKNDPITNSMAEGTNDTTEKMQRVISCGRELRAKFEIEDYTTKMNVRKISDTEKLLEFYVSIYPDEYNRKSRFFLSEIKKAVKNPRMADFLNINTVEFVSYNTSGVKDMLEFEYKITEFDKIIEFNGFHVIKFKAEVTKNGESLTKKFEKGAGELMRKYDNKEKRDN